MRHIWRCIIIFTKRQQQIVRIVEKKQPITGDEISKILGITKSTLRSDFSILTKSNILLAKPKIGYSLSHEHYANFQKEELKTQIIENYIEVPNIIDHTMSIKDAIIELFMRNANTLFIIENNYLIGVISQKDLLKFSMNTKEIDTIPVKLAMTRKEQLIFCTNEMFINSAIEKLYLHNIETIPVITHENEHMKIIGQITKTIATKLLYELIKN